jgi:hypothetical protein
MSVGFDNRGTKFPLTIVRGADMAFQLTVTDSADAAVDVSAATIAGEIYSTAGALVDTLTAVVSGAGDNVVTLSFTDTETTAFTSDAYQWTLWVTRGGDKRPWLAGPVRVTDGTNGGRSTSDATLTVDSDLTVAVTVNAIGGAGVSSGAGAPASTPSTVGLIYIDTTAGTAYIATGVASPADWTGILTA